MKVKFKELNNLFRLIIFSLKVNGQIKELKGPSFKERWAGWKSVNDEQKSRSATINELERLMKSFEVFK